MADDPQTQNTKPGQPRSRKNTKRTGEFSEAAFLTKATGLGFKVAKPWGDSERYDFIVDCSAHSSPGCFWRVQVKSVSVRPANGIYHVATMRSVASNKKPYRAGDFDFLAAYIIPRGLWYIIPAML